MDGQDEWTKKKHSIRGVSKAEMESSSSSSTRVTVFIDTNIGTHFAIPISPDIAVPDLKRELESKHLSCFPDVGEIKVNSLMVKRKSRLYYLSESFPLKYAFLDIKRAYFFYIEVCRHSNSENVDLSERVAKKEPETCVVSDSKCKRKKRKFKRFHNVLREVLRAGHVLSKKRKKKRKCLENNFVPPIRSEQGRDRNFIPLDGTPSDTSSSESVSVSGIIKKYFDGLTSSSEVKFAGWPEEQVKFRRYDDNWSGPQNNNIPPETTSHSSSSGVGKRLVTASNNLRISQSKRKPAISLCEKLNVPKSCFVRSLVFEIH